MTRYRFEFISAYDCRSDYRLFADGRDLGRITAHHRTSRLTGRADQTLPPDVIEAFNAKCDADWREAVERYSGEFCDAPPAQYTA